MTADTSSEQLTKYLTDVHSIEEQALAQMRLAPRLAGAAELQRIFVCGPTGFVEGVAAELVGLGHGADRIRTERFGATG